MDYTFDGSLELSEHPITVDPELYRLLSPIHNAIQQIASKEKNNSTTVGSQTLEGKCGRFRIAAAGVAATITNKLIDVNTLVFAQVATNDATAWVKNVVPAAGSFTVNLGAAATGQIDVIFFIIN